MGADKRDRPAPVMGPSSDGEGRTSSLKARRLDDAVGATFPADLLAQLKVGEGDVLETSDGLLLAPHDPGSPGR